MGALELAGSPIVLVEGLAGVEGIAELTEAFGSDDLGFRRRWEWSAGAGGSGLTEATLSIEFGHEGRRWSLAVRFDPESAWTLDALVPIASGQLFSFADSERLPPPAGDELDLLLPLMLDLDPAFLGAVGESVGGTLELALAVHRFEHEQRAEAASQRAAEAMGSLGFVWRLRERTAPGARPEGGFVLVAVAFSQAGAEEASTAMTAAGGSLQRPAGALREAIEARLWPGVEEGAAEAAGEARPGRRGGLILIDDGRFAPFGPEVG